MFVFSVPWDRNVVTKEDEKIANYSPVSSTVIGTTLILQETLGI